MAKLYILIICLLYSQNSYAENPNTPGWMMGMSLAGGIARGGADMKEKFALSSSEIFVGGLTPWNISITGHLQELRMSQPEGIDKIERSGTLVGGELAYHVSRFRLAARASTGTVSTETNSNDPRLEDSPIHVYGAGLNIHLVQTPYFTWDLFAKASRLEVLNNTAYIPQQAFTSQLGMGISVFPNWPSPRRSTGYHIHHGPSAPGSFNFLWATARVGLRLTEVLLRAAL